MYDGGQVCTHTLHHPHRQNQPLCYKPGSGSRSGSWPCELSLGGRIGPPDHLVFQTNEIRAKHNEKTCMYALNGKYYITKKKEMKSMLYIDTIAGLFLPLLIDTEHCRLGPSHMSCSVIPIHPCPTLVKTKCALAAVYIPTH